MSSKLDLFIYTENKPRKFNLMWIVGDVLKIPKTLKSPTFSFFPELPDEDNWNLCIDNSDPTSTSLSLHYASNGKMNLRVEYTVVFRKPDGKWITELRGNHVFSTDESIVLHSKLNEIVSLGRTDMLSVEFNFTIHGGMNMEADTLFYLIGGDSYVSVPPRDFIEKKNLIDLEIRVVDRIFMAHKFIVRMRMPKFADEYLKDLNVKEITVKGLEPGLFEDIMNYIYEGLMPNFALLLQLEQLYDFSWKYDLKDIHRRCVEELESSFNNENAVKYLKKAVHCGDEALKKVTYSFINKNRDSISEMSEWKALVLSDPRLAEEVLKFKI